MIGSSFILSVPPLRIERTTYTLERKRKLLLDLSAILSNNQRKSVSSSFSLKAKHPYLEKFHY